METAAKKKRISIIDSIRGILVVSMVFYHCMYDLVYIFGMESVWFSISGCFVWQQSTLWSFILLSGISFHFGKHPIKRGVLILAAAGLLWLVTLLVLPSEEIRFGVLHFLGTAGLLTVLAMPVLKRVPPIGAMLFCILLFALCRNIAHGSIGIGILHFSLPEWLYSTKWLYWLGFPDASFLSADYVPMLPWIFLYWTGYFLWKAVTPAMKEGMKLWRHEPVFSFLGRNSLLIYILHQPVLYGVLLLLERLGIF